MNHQVLPVVKKFHDETKLGFSELNKELILNETKKLLLLIDEQKTLFPHDLLSDVSSNSDLTLPTLVNVSNLEVFLDELRMIDRNEEILPNLEWWMRSVSLEDLN
jgi:hypothetical protein